ncbi:MAG TPA: TonB-dependent receptor [Puia sp.]|uniref:TonB-dependent receptor n=1 Tax=Puia sp. TaxID=2045100 RepID=UPI002C9429E0|nr:TonB-dependent receptor [Puia sp.]HVU96552.1 TonB-dependent receptor [Puia sp.]
MLKKTGLSLFSVFSSFVLVAQEAPKDTTRTQTLNTVQVTSWSAGKKDNQLDVPRSVGVLSAEDFHRNNGLSLENSLNLIPGVSMGSRTTFGGQRIIIRGYGNNTNFNGQGVQVLLNNIPITDATGATILDDIDFATLGKVEVVKGPASSLYGAGVAGVVNLFTLKPRPNQTRFVEENTGGSNGLWRTNTRFETANEHSSLLVNYGHQEQEGWRTNSASRKDYAQFSGDFYVSDKNTLSAYFAYAHSLEQLAGEMTDSIIYHRIVWSDPAYLVNGSKTVIESFRAGLTDNYRIDGHFSNQTTVYTNSYTLNQPFAHGLTDNQAFTFGGRTGFVYSSDTGNVTVHAILGAQFQKTIAFNKSYNLANNVPGGIRGDLQNSSQGYNVFTEWKFSLPAKWIVTAGGSLDFTEYAIADMLANSANPTHANQSGDKSFSPVFMPRISLLKLLNEHVSVYADLSRGYTPPPTSNVINSVLGTANKSLKPESAFQYEIGSKGDLLDGKLSYQLALFDLDIRNKIVAQQVPASGTTPTYTTYVNAGRQQNLGAELALSYAIVNSPNSAVTLLRPFVTYTYSDFKYKDFYSDNNHNAATLNFSNNKVAGVAPNVVNLGIDVQTKPGFYAYLTYRHVDAVPYTFDNKYSARPFNLFNGKIGYRSQLGNHFSVDLYAGADNLTNSTYYSFLFFSGTLAGTTDPHFLPMPYNAAWYGGAKLAYIF